MFLFAFIILISAICIYIIYGIAPKNNLRKTILSALSGATGKYSVVVKNLETEEAESLYGDKVYKIGSLYKLWIMAETFNQIQKGTLSKDEILSEDVRALNKEFGIDPEYAELTDGTVTLSVENALKQMISISHNYAALLLTKKIGLSNIAKFLEVNGFKNSRVGEIATSTANDIALFLEKLYKNELNNERYTREMLDLLKSQTFNDKLPKYLPKGIAVAHKTGELDYLSHDAGIIYSQNGDYLIVVLSETSYPPGAEERIAQISKSAYDYFSKKNNKK